VPMVTLAGYTNAGKSTLFNQLTSSDIYADDRLFATLDATIRSVILPASGKAVIVDTVGFINDLPKDLIQAFKSTLEESISADVLLHIIDASDENSIDKQYQVETILGQIGANSPQLLVMNKIDKLEGVAPKIDRDENVIDVIDRSRLTSHKLIEEFMLAANIVAADFLEKNCKKGIFRVHGNPESIKIDRLSQTLKRRSINWQGDIEDIQNLPFFLEKIQNRKDASILNTLILQAMQRAEYTTENIGHFGLKYKKYTHFTSPIRRYPDLLVHRLIIATLSNEAVEDQELQGLLEYCSAQEKSAEFASKQVIQNLLCEYAANFKGKSFKGFITGVKDFGLFVDVPFAIKSPFEFERVPSTKATDLPSLITFAAAITIPGFADFKKVIFNSNVKGLNLKSVGIITLCAIAESIQPVT